MAFVRPRYTTEETDRHGKTRIYYRRKGRRKVVLDGEPGGDLFWAQYAAALAGRPIPRIGETKGAPTPRETIVYGSLHWLCIGYFESDAYKGLDESTRRVRRQIIEHCLDEPTEPGGDLLFKNVSAHKITRGAIRALRDRKKELPESANGRVKAFRQVFKWAIAEGDEEDCDWPSYLRLDINPAALVTYLNHKNQDGFHTWEIHEIRQFEERHPVGTKARLALALLMYLGPRRSDVVQFGRQHVRAGELKFRVFKGRKRAPKDLALPILPELQTIIDASSAIIGDLAFLVTEFGKPFSRAGFGNWFRKRCDEASLPQCSAHGIRKAAACIAAENGATTKQLMAIFGWETVKQAELYTKQAEQKRLAAAGMASLILDEDGTKVSNQLYDAKKVGQKRGKR